MRLAVAIGTSKQNTVLLSCNASFSHDKAMWQQAGGKGARKGDSKSKGESKYIKKVDLWRFFVKWILRSYATEDGDMLFTDGKSAREYYTTESVRAMLEGETSELIRRPAMGFNLTASTMQSGLKKLALLTPPGKIESEADAATAKKNFNKSGFGGFLAWLEEDGQELQEIVEYLNRSNDEMNRTPTDTKIQVGRFLALFGKGDHEKRMETYARMADCSASLLGLATYCMEATALCTDTKSWAKQIPEREKQSAEIRKWMKERSKKYLEKAIAAAYDVKGGRDARRKARKDSDDDDDDGKAGASDSESRSRSQNKIHKKKKSGKKTPSNKKEKKEKRGNSSRSQSSCKSKRSSGSSEHETKGDKNSKKKRGKSSASDSDKSDKKIKRKRAKSSASDNAKRDKKIKKTRAKSSASDSTNERKQHTKRAGSSASESDDKTKKKKRSAQQEKSAKDKEQGDSTKGRPALDYSTWDLKDLHKAEKSLSIGMNKAELASLESTDLQAFLEQIPIQLRKAHHLPTAQEDYSSELEKPEAVACKIMEILFLVKKAWAARTSFLDKPAAKWGIELELEGYGLLAILVEDEVYLTNRDEMKTIVDEAKGDNATPENKAAACMAQKNVLRTQVADTATATFLWEKSMRMAEKFYRIEPSIQELNEYLQLLDADLRMALQIKAAAKYEMKNKPAGWKADLVRCFTMSYLAFVAWSEE